MLIQSTIAREFLAKSDLRGLFNELGWDRNDSKVEIEIGGMAYPLRSIAHKRGMVAYECVAATGGVIPNYAERRKIERKATKYAHEHLIVFTDSQRQTQIWQWVKREPGSPVACREHTFNVSQPADALLQKLESIAFTLEEEEQLSLVDVTRRARVGFDVEKVTKRFYDDFQKEHQAFLKFIAGITELADKEWYASLMLNRLMFVYFIQRKGFLDSDKDYLRHRLDRTRTEHGEDKFHSFYRYFLLRFFHEGLGSRERTPEFAQLVGRIPYLNGGLFDIHELERPEKYGEEIQIPDKAFERIFDFLDKWDWTLDPTQRTRQASDKPEISPDVLGFVFEKYINQKQMGAYYTKEDITGYIGKNTVLPFLFDAAKTKCKIAFENPNGHTVWELLKNDPDRYIYEAVRTGSELPLPPEIQKGVNPPTLHQIVGDGPVATLEARKGWNKPASASYALPTETWREVVARRIRYEEIRAKLVADEVREIGELITLNLDIRQFAQDVIENCEGPELLRAFWQAIQKLTVLDPTCGSGAFLFAALNILEPLYEACLDRMEVFVAELAAQSGKQHPEKFSDFRKVLAQIEAHPNRRYFILKSIILNNLFGVDIMEEAAEICKLRLFLKLAAQIDPDTTKPNLGIEPLPDIDFNIKAGNTLVGYATLDDARLAVTSTLDFDNVIEKIERTAADLQQAFDAFRERQIAGDDSVPFEDKQELRNRLGVLAAELNSYKAKEYRVDAAKPKVYEKWLKSHQPFHWIAEFYGIIKRGGFDVILGNPPFVEYVKVKPTYQVLGFATIDSANLYAFVLERSLALISPLGRLGLITPIALVSVGEAESARRLLVASASKLWLSNYAIRPAKLFEGVEQRLTIILAELGGLGEKQVRSTKFLQWYKDERLTLFAVLDYSLSLISSYKGSIAKVGGPSSLNVLRKLAAVQSGSIGEGFAARGGTNLFFHRTPGYWIRVMNFEPHFRSPTATRSIHHIRELHFHDREAANFAGAVVSSSLYFLWFFALGNCRNLTLDDVKNFQVGSPSPSISRKAAKLFGELMRDFQDNSFVSTRGVTEFQEFEWGHAKPIIDRIDTVLAEHFGLTEEELDFVISYDIKIRMGSETDETDE